MNWFEQIAFQAKLRPEEPAVIFPGGMATYARLVECVEHASQHLLRAGVTKGEIIALEIRHPLLHLVAILALHRCGVASLTLQTGHLAEQSQLKIDRLLSDRFQPSEQGWKQVMFTNEWLLPPKPGTPLLPLAGFNGIDDVCRIVLSSGTTGTPKAISVTERTLQHRFDRASILTERGRYLCMMGFSTLGGYQTLMSALVLGGAICFAGAPEDVLQVMGLYHVTHLIAAPFQIRAVLDSQTKSAMYFPSLRNVLLAGGHISNALIAEVSQKLCPNVGCVYGSTELGIVAFAPAAAMRGIEGATGFVLPGEVVEIVEKNGAALPRGEEGIVRIKSDRIDRYFVPTPDDAEIFKDGYFYPGDLGRLMQDGLLVITGRSNEVINRGGSKAAPELIEEVLRKRPEIADAAVFAVPNTDQIWAAVVCKGRLQQKEILALCKEKLGGLAPDRLIELDEIPRNDMGKIIREKMKDKIMRKLAFTFMTS
jgi:acyl-coenzyme A synthetase/AMP-(fatty) acid ligase